MKSKKTIIKEFNDIPSEDRAFDAMWYQIAHNYAKAVAKHHGISLVKVCGVISALSQANEWENNKEEAHKLIHIYVNDGDFTITKFRTYGNNVAKAIQILELDESDDQDGEQQPNIATEIGNILLGRVGYKTMNFFYNIFDPSDRLSVTIDRHMLRYLGEEKVKSRAHYGLMAKRVRDTAKNIGLVPSALQAVLWEEGE